MSIIEITIRAIILDLGGDGIETRDLQDGILLTSAMLSSS